MFGAVISMPSALSLSIVLAVFGLIVPPLTAAPPADKSLAALSAESRAETLMEKVVLLLKTKQYAEALRLLAEAEAISPGDPTTRNAKAAALIQTDRFDEAEGILTDLIAENPQFFQANYNMGEILFLKKDYPAAVAHFQRMQNVHGPLPLIRFKRMLCEILSNDTVSAEITLRTFRFPADAPAWYFAYAAMALFHGDRSEAKALMDTATRIHGKDGTALFVETITDSELSK